MGNKHISINLIHLSHGCSWVLSNLTEMFVDFLSLQVNEGTIS
jgi:hypothetical protein